MNNAMNTVNQTFSWSRFTAALRKELVENKRTILFTVISTYALLTMFMIFGNLITGLVDAYEGAMEMHAPKIFVATVLSMFVCVTASLAFKNLRTKTGRISMFCSPVSTLEKYLVNVLIYVVGAIVTYLACAHLADLTRFAALWFFRGESLFVPGPMNFLNALTELGTRPYDVNQVASPFSVGSWMWISLIAGAGEFLLGSVLWPRLSLLKTIVAIYAIQTCFFIIAAPLFYFFGDIETLGEMAYSLLTGGTLSIAMVIWYVILCVLTFGGAWYLFKHKDVISLKWWK